MFYPVEMLLIRMYFKHKQRKVFQFLFYLLYEVVCETILII